MRLILVAGLLWGATAAEASNMRIQNASQADACVAELRLGNPNVTDGWYRIAKGSTFTFFNVDAVYPVSCQTGQFLNLVQSANWPTQTGCVGNPAGFQFTFPLADALCTQQGGTPRLFYAAPNVLQDYDKVLTD